ncbi:glycosyltransferase family 76 protein [Polychaeton citri CBS 116435]|uniref:GPI mannosyltransferase 2 n=1 Tax=Polychaeton citri CBS 116435 TaxID=1314669 RepID=A0A9P4UTK1_9PEZI|nr:glycosyltransferase family 76 protein [Polychaeton citri CBS 116435]
MDVIRTYVSPSRQGGPAGPRGKAAVSDGSHASGPGNLVTEFLQWKIILFVAICASPTADYDTSTVLLFELSDRVHGPAASLRWLLERVAVKFTRWDAIYFTSASARGHIYEQEWAFSWAFSKLSSFVARVLLLPLPLDPTVKHAIAGILISNTAHLLSVIVLYYLVKELLPSPSQRGSRLASTAALLHVVSPGGVFLSAPYGESAFALLNFLGMLTYSWATKMRYSTIADAGVIDAFWTIISGVFFGLAGLIRGNALLSGSIFVLDALSYLPQLPKALTNATDITRLAGIAIAGLLTGIGFALPQYVAYQEYCTGDEQRPWCSSMPPSIYTFVQREYWDVGFLRYWTLNNLPLFFLALPMLMLLSLSDREANAAIRVFRTTLTRFAVPQLMLAVMALTSFHVQIINRISSGYPLWYLLVAVTVHAASGPTTRHGSGWSVLGKFGRTQAEWLARGIIVYALVQAGLYANFLPPA